jgi:nucleoid DNA-binding protein
MRKAQWWGLAGLLAALVLIAGAAAPAQTGSGKKKKPQTLQSRIAKATKLKEKNVAKMLRALGPAITAQLQAGKSVDLAGVGTFRVVQVAEHRNLVNGRVVRVPAANYIEFVPSGTLNGAAAATPAPARTVPAFEYNPRPYETPGFRTEGLKVGRTRTR